MLCCGYSDIFEIMTGKRDKTQVEQVQTSKGIRFQIMFYRFTYIAKIPNSNKLPPKFLFFLHIFTFQEIKTPK